MNVLEYFKGKFTFDIEDAVIATAVYDRTNGMVDIDDDMYSSENILTTEKCDLVVADVIMAFYRTPSGMNKDIDNGTFKIRTRSDVQTFTSLSHLYEYAQGIYKMYHDLRYENDELSVLSV